MDDSSSLSYILMLILLVVDALLTTGYAAIQNSRQSELEALAGEGKGYAKTALALIDRKSELYTTYTLASTLINFGIAILACIEWIVPVFGENPPMNLATSIALVLGAGLVSLILGTIVPEAVGSAYARGTVAIFAFPVHIITIILSPLVRILLFISRLLAKLSGSEKLVNTVTEEEIMTLVNAGNTDGTIEDEEKEMIYSVLQLGETWARELMVPRIDMVTIEISTSLKDALDLFLKSGFSRIPVYEENIDNMTGLLYSKDILNLWNNGGLDNHTVRELLRSAYFVPETRPVDELLRDLQSRNIHMAIVVDEYGGTAGLVTIENIIEEIVGDIRDEYDHDEEYEYIKTGDDEYVIDASMDIDDVNDLLGTKIDSEDTDTLGGFIYLKIGRVPISGETIETDEITLTVRSIEGRRIRKVFVKVKPKQQDGEERDVKDESANGDETQQVVDTP